MNRPGLIGWLLAWVALPLFGEIGPVPVDFFFEQGCEQCKRVRAVILPGLEQQCGGRYVLLEHEIGNLTNYLALAAYQERFKVKDNESVTMVVDGRDYLAGISQLSTGLAPAVERAWARQMETGSEPAVAAPAVEEGIAAGRQRVDQFTLWGVIVAAAVDSLNPCAISTLVFFLSLLAVTRIGVARMWLAGGAYLLACYLTYLGIGLGLLRVLSFLQAWRQAGVVLEWGMAVLLVGFAGISLADAIRFHRHPQADAVTLKLPDRIQERIHRVIKGGLRTHHVILGGFATGVMVTVLESVCTGQVYVPVLVAMLKLGYSVWTCLGYLLVYNLVFVLPLMVLLVLVCMGLKTQVLLAWSRGNVVFSKLLLSLFFMGMAIWLILGWVTGLKKTEVNERDA